MQYVRVSKDETKQHDFSKELLVYEELQRTQSDDQSKAPVEVISTVDIKNSKESSNLNQYVLPDSLMRVWNFPLPASECTDMNANNETGTKYIYIYHYTDILTSSPYKNVKI